jgi:hypothetical protein
MAENETLNLNDRHSGRWRDLMRFVERGSSVDEVRQEAVRCLHAAVKNLVELLPLGELLGAAAGENGPVAEVVARCSKGREYAQLFEGQANRGLTREQTMTNVLVTALESFFDQMSLRIVPSEKWTYASLVRFFGEVRQAAMGDIRELAADLARHPHEAPRMPALSKAAKDERWRQLTDMSLLPE